MILELLQNEQTGWHGVTLQNLLELPEESLGFSLAHLWLNQQIGPHGGFERHDAAQALTGIGTCTVGEIRLQYYLLGNGQRNLYGIAYLMAGTLFYPHQLKSFVHHYKKGKLAHRFYDLDFLKLLPQPLQNLREAFKIELK